MKTKNRKAKAVVLEAVEWAGGLAPLAAEMRVSEQTVREWLKLGRVPPTPARLMAILVSSVPSDLEEEPGLEKTLRA